MESGSMKTQAFWQSPNCWLQFGHPPTVPIRHWGRGVGVAVGVAVTVGVGVNVGVAVRVARGPRWNSPTIPLADAPRTSASTSRSRTATKITTNALLDALPRPDGMRQKYQRVQRSANQSQRRGGASLFCPNQWIGWRQIEPILHRNAAIFLGHLFL